MRTIRNAVRDVVLDRFTNEEITDYLARRLRRSKDPGFYYVGSDSEKVELFNSVISTDNKKMYEETMWTIRDRIDSHLSTHKGHDSINREVRILQSFRKIISLDLSYSSISQFMYNEDANAKERTFMPLRYVTDDGMIKNIECTDKYEIDIKGKYLIDCPYQNDKFFDHLFRESELDPKKVTEGEAHYYPELDLVIIGTGTKHRTAEAYINRETARIPVEVDYDLDKYKYIKTDGDRWISTVTGDTIGRTGNFKIAVIFSLKQRELTLMDYVSTSTKWDGSR